MKKLISVIAIASIFAGFAAVDQADAGHKYKYKYKYQYKNKFPSPFRFRPAFPAPRVIVSPPPVIVAPVPAFTYAYEQVWVEPVYQQVVSGYDSCGNPIYQQVCSQPGYYRTAKYQVFPNGYRQFVCYQ